MIGVAQKDTQTARGSASVSRNFSDATADVLQLKALLAAKIVGVLDEEGLSVRKAEAATGIAAADFSRLRTAKLERFTIDRMLTILKRLDQEIDVAVATRPNHAKAPALDVSTTAATQAFMGRLEGRYAVKAVILFGSRARQTHRPDSDADLAVVLEGPAGQRSRTAMDMADLAYDVMLETGVMIEALPLWESEFDLPERFNNPALIRNIQREGVRL